MHSHFVEDGSGRYPAPPWLLDGVRAALRGYQREWLALGQQGDIAHRGARQLGKDHTWAFEPALDVATRRGQQWSVLSASFSHSKDFLADASKHLDYLELLHRQNGVAFPKRTSDTVSQIVLDNGSAIKAYAATPKNAQGRRGNIVLNEIGIMPRAALIYETADAVVQGQRSRGLTARYRIIGNASVYGSFFQKFWEGRLSRSFIKITTTWEEAMTRWLRDDLGHPLEKVTAWVEMNVKRLIGRLGVPAFGQWYRCEWRAPAGGFFPPELLDAVQYDPDLERIPTDFPALSSAQVRQGIGWDPARRRHPAGLAQSLEGLPRRSGERRRFIWRPQRLIKVPWHLQLDRIEALKAERNTVKITVDRQGIGDMPAEEATRRWGEGLVEGYAFSTSSRVRLFNSLLHGMQLDVVAIPVHTDLRMELESVQQSYTKEGREGVVIPETESEGGEDTHGDLAVAAALADWGLTHPGGAFFGGWV
ncbi:MAG: hypothetical protein CMH57_02760 [Myxococcales bacterium]|nr:hypothetical protein [Myxococcales bacterium]